MGEIKDPRFKYGYALYCIGHFKIVTHRIIKPVGFILKLSVSKV